MGEHNASDTIEVTGCEPPVSAASEPATKHNGKETSHIERVLSPDVDDAIEKSKIDISRIDKEVQQYAAAGRVEVDPETSKRLLRKIDRHVLTFMVITYFLQAIDKGTLAFTSIMGLKQDTGLVGQQVGLSIHLSSAYNTDWRGCQVFVAYHLHLYCRFGCRIPNKLDLAESADCKIPRLQHYLLGHCACLSCRVPQLYRSGHRSNSARYFRGLLSACICHFVRYVVQT